MASSGEKNENLENSFHGLTPEELGRWGQEFCARDGTERENDARAFRLGAMIAGDMNRYDAVTRLTVRERKALDPKLAHKWRNLSTLYAVIHMCSPCAVFGIGDPYAARRDLHDAPEPKRGNRVGNRHFVKQFCGVKAITYYSTETFIQSGFQEQAALAASLGVINWLFALPGMYTIDTLGRGKLLLTTSRFWVTGDSTAHLACIAVGIYLFSVVYSPREGPVPFTYTAKAYQLGGVDEAGRLLLDASWNPVGFVAVLLFPARDQGEDAWGTRRHPRRARGAVPQPPMPTWFCDNVEYARERSSKERESDPTARV
ncbi:hypothetical protein DL764_010939 [Monosporascus ibericus]|uniref:Major facilitator superfamily (MFS) profile domain-containing protein n=1 Tax=Monosporascus ibericus TaxID=155417 RepID=A0A4Q4SRR9_9PEZI|nr:hypothetical protein DL764_010939 [Monosporascus ibericus]